MYQNFSWSDVVLLISAFGLAWPNPLTAAVAVFAMYCCTGISLVDCDHNKLSRMSIGGTETSVAGILGLLGDWTGGNNSTLT